MYTYSVSQLPDPNFVGLVWAEVKQLWDEGLKAYIQDMWNILDFITNSLYIATFTLKLVAYMKVRKGTFLSFQSSH